MFNRRSIAALVVFAVLLALAPAAQGQEAEETPVTFIELAGPVVEGDSELSGLAWYGDYLLLLAEEPYIYATEDNAGMFFALDKTDILDYLLAMNDGEAPDPLEPMAVPIIAPDLVETVGGFGEYAFNGIESIVFVDDQVYLTIEAEKEADGTMRAYLVGGAVEPDLSAITLDLENWAELETPTEYNNISYEATFVAGDMLVTMYESNGAAVVEAPVAYAVSMDLATVETVPMANVEFRVTDATTLDDDGVFWVTNYFWTGESEAWMATDADPLFEQYGMGASQAAIDGYERLVALQYGEDGITVADIAPIQLLMTEESNGRNWEGIARLDDLGLLIATDSYPATLLGFVPVE
jgi:hypothetical protein